MATGSPLDTTPITGVMVVMAGMAVTAAMAEVTAVAATTKISG